ncbi:MAG: hypothetical protein ACSLFN_12155 [Candidatus Limnocylindrales bacterium]
MTEVAAVPRNVADLLAAWRAADRRWETTPQDDPTFRDVGIAVIRAWLGYQAAIGQLHAGESPWWPTTIGSSSRPALK